MFFELSSKNIESVTQLARCALDVWKHVYFIYIDYIIHVEIFTFILSIFEPTQLYTQD
jgi:hypothetical protein